MFSLGLFVERFRVLEISLIIAYHRPIKNECYRHTIDVVNRTELTRAHTHDQMIHTITNY